MNNETGPDPRRQGTRADRRRALTRAKLIEAGFHAIADHGVDATIQHITEAADVGFGTFYTHFATKDKLLDALAVEVSERIAGPAAAIVDPIEDPAERLAAWTRLLLREFRDLHGSAQFVVAALGQERQLRVDLGRWMVRTVQQGIASGRFVDDAFPTGITVLGGSFQGYLRARDADLVPENDTAFVASLLRSLGVDRTDAAAVAERSTSAVADAEVYR